MERVDNAAFEPQPKPAVSPETRLRNRAQTKKAHDDRKAAGKCVNNCGPATHGTRCCRCSTIHTRGLARAEEQIAALAGGCPKCGQQIPSMTPTELEEGA